MGSAVPSVRAGARNTGDAVRADPEYCVTERGLLLYGAIYQ